MATGAKKDPNTIDVMIGAETSGTTTTYHFVDLDSATKSNVVDRLWAPYPSAQLQWWVDNQTDQAIEVRINLGHTSPNPPATPASSTKTIRPGKSRPFTASVTRWPFFGIETHQYAIEVRTAGSGDPWQNLDPELELERPFGSYKLILATAVLGGAVGAALVLAYQALRAFG